MFIENMLSSDWPIVAQIYEEGIQTGIATFETQAPSYEDWDKAHETSCRLVAKKENTIMGWAAISQVSSRCVYCGVGEVSIYIGKAYRGQGVGLMLLKALIQESEAAGYWTLQSGIFPENKASIKLHERAGFRFLGKRERIAKINGVWKDNLLFEKRSTRIGV
ncbi:MAG: N-acetyltransferase family protein [Bacteroidota bacterium]